MRYKFLTNEVCFTKNNPSYNFKNRVVNKNIERDLARFKI